MRRKTTGQRGKWIAVFDHKPTSNSPAGSCVLAEVMGLCDEYDITVFSDAFDNGRPDRVRWVRVPLPKKPGFLRYVVYQVLAPIYLRLHVLKRGSRPALIQATQGQFIGCDVAYPHFCHRAYLRNLWRRSDVRGLRRLARWLSHRYNAATEAPAFARARLIVTPSQGLAREIEATYPDAAGKVMALPNPVEVARFARPPDFDRGGVRAAHGMGPDDVVLAFVALGDFARKGLGIVLEAMKFLPDPAVKLWVVGGSRGEIRKYREIAGELGLTGRVAFVGFQPDVRPFFWGADLFVFPSVYETFLLVALQAAAAGVPVVCTRVYGVEEYVRDGRNGRFVERDAACLSRVLKGMLEDRPGLRSMGEAAADTARGYDVSRFVERWRGVMQAVRDAGDASCRQRN